MGQGAKYRGQIKTEISRIIREMEQIDLDRNADLQKRLAARNAKNPHMLS